MQAAEVSLKARRPRRAVILTPSLKITAGKGKWLSINSAPSGIEVDTSYSTGFRTSAQVVIQNS